MNNPSQDKSAIKRWLKHKQWRLSHKLHDFLYPAVNWFYWNYKYEMRPDGSKWRAGLSEACWCFLTGDGIVFSLHIGNVYWGIGRK